jgi:hypothetical protein
VTTIFADDFEMRNFSKWTGSILGTQPGSVKEVIGAAAYAGAVGAHFSNGVGGTLSTGSYAWKDFTSPANRVVSAQTRIKINSTAGTGSVRLFQFRDNTTGQSMARVSYVNGVIQLVMVRRNATVVTANLPSTLANGSWHLLELMYDWSGAQPVATVWVDGVVQATLTDTTAGTTYAVTRVIVEAYEDKVTASADAYFDDVRVATGYIGGSP